MVVVGGNHRVGALAALQSPTIPIELHPDRPSLVQLEHIKDWPMVQNETFSIPLATAIFTRFFEPAMNVIEQSKE